MWQRREAAAVFAALADRHGGRLSREQTVALLASVGVGEGGEQVELLWNEMGLAPNAHITQACAAPGWQLGVAAPYKLPWNM